MMLNYLITVHQCNLRASCYQLARFAADVINNVVHYHLENSLIINLFYLSTNTAEEL